MPRYYTEEHEWIDVDGDVATVGITDFAQGQLGDIVFVEVPDTGAELSQCGDSAVVESVKAASDVYAPVDGTVTEGNAHFEEDSALVYSDPECEGRFFRMTSSDKCQCDWWMYAFACNVYSDFLCTIPPFPPSGGDGRG